MKRFAPLMILLAFGLALFAGCGDDDDDGPNGPVPLPRLQAASSASALAVRALIDSLGTDSWDGVDSLSINVAGTFAPKLPPSAAASLPTTAKVQAVATATHLVLRVQWVDNTFSAYPDHWTAASTGPGVTFSYHELADEDQLVVLFQKPTAGQYDVWNWKVLRTGAAGMGKGYSLDGTTWTADALGTAPSVEPAYSNRDASFPEPEWVSEDTSEFEGYVLLLDDAVPKDDYAFTTGWTVGDTLPGYVIDTSILIRTEAQRGSRWDIFSTGTYSSASDVYEVVLGRKLNTTYADDLNLAPLDSVEVMLGFYDDQDDLALGGSRRSFSEPFWLVFPQ